MPGRDCAVFGCGSCRRTKGIGIWKLPLVVYEKHREWREAWLGELKKTRVIDSALLLINTFISQPCEVLHYKEKIKRTLDKTRCMD